MAQAREPAQVCWGDGHRGCHCCGFAGRVPWDVPILLCSLPSWSGHTCCLMAPFRWALVCCRGWRRPEGPLDSVACPRRGFHLPSVQMLNSLLLVPLLPKSLGWIPKHPNWSLFMHNCPLFIWLDWGFPDLPWVTFPRLFRAKFLLCENSTDTYTLTDAHEHKHNELEPHTCIYHSYLGVSS